jgi:hypothetical protein
MSMGQSTHSELTQLRGEFGKACGIAESVRRLLRRRPLQPRFIVKSVQIIDRSEIVPIDFGALDKAMLPPGTIQACCALSAVLAEHVVRTNLQDAQANMWVREDGRIVAIAQNQESNEMRVLEEVWGNETL